MGKTSKHFTETTRPQTLETKAFLICSNSVLIWHLHKILLPIGNKSLTNALIKNDSIQYIFGNFWENAYHVILYYVSNFQKCITNWQVVPFWYAKPPHYTVWNTGWAFVTIMALNTFRIFIECVTSSKNFPCTWECIKNQGQSAAVVE